MATVRLTMAQALVRYLAAQRVLTENGTEPLFGGVWAIFGHGNVAGIDRGDGEGRSGVGHGWARRTRSHYPQGRKLIKPSLLKQCCLALALLAATQLANAAAIDKLRQFLDATKTLRAEFNQMVVAKNGKKPQLSSGVMMFSRPGKFRWEVVKPYEQLLVGDGEKVWI